jgi:hypothetical protein
LKAHGLQQLAANLLIDTMQQKTRCSKTIAYILPGMLSKLMGRKLAVFLALPLPLRIDEGLPGQHVQQVLHAASLAHRLLQLHANKKHTAGCITQLRMLARHASLI